MLDPTRVTLFLGNTGMNGYDFREKILMDRFGIQINKTSINSVLLIFTIGVTWSSVHHLLDVLRRVATDFDREKQAASAADWALHERRVEEITQDLPHLPDFSEFDIAFRPVDACSFGDMRAAFYAGYEESDREYVLIGTAGRRLAEGKRLVSTTFVVPYPPGFPVLVPGQVVSKEIVYFLAQLDVKEIHGYNHDLGLSVFTQEALARMEAQRNAATAAVGAAVPVFEISSDASTLGVVNGDRAVRGGCQRRVGDWLLLSAIRKAARRPGWRNSRPGRVLAGTSAEFEPAQYAELPVRPASGAMKIAASRISVTTWQ